jgi:hypothetical protein
VDQHTQCLQVINVYANLRTLLLPTQADTYTGGDFQNKLGQGVKENGTFNGALSEAKKIQFFSEIFFNIFPNFSDIFSPIFFGHFFPNFSDIFFLGFFSDIFFPFFIDLFHLELGHFPMRDAARLYLMGRKDASDDVRA